MTAFRGFLSALGFSRGVRASRPAVFVVAVFLSASLPCGAADAGKGNGFSEGDILRLLAAGGQKSAETKVAATLRREPENPQALFWSAVLARTRFTVPEALPGFARTLQARPDSPEGMASACILGIDLSGNEQTQLYYFNALLILAEQHPDSIPIHWLTATMARSLTRYAGEYDDVINRIMLRGVVEYEKTLALLARVAPGLGPVQIHQSLSNMLDNLDGSDLALVHREAALKLERTPKTLGGAAETLNKLGRPTEAIPLLQEAIPLDPDPEAIFYQLGNAYRHLGRLPEAIAAWDRAVAVNRYSYHCLKLCAMGSRDLGNYAAARDYARKALAVFPKDRFFQIWEARFATMLGEPGAGERAIKAGQFDYNENALEGKAPPANPWFAAAQTGNVQKLRELIPTGDINRVSEPYKQTALMNAAQDGWETVATELIKAGANINQKDINGDTALNYAAEFNNPRLIKILMDAGADPNIADQWSETPLTKSARHRDWEGFLFLMDKRTNVDAGGGGRGTALHWAAGYGQIAMMDVLIKYGANPNLADNAGRTPLIFVCGEYAHVFAITPLLKAGADINAQDKEGLTGLRRAVNPLLNIASIEWLLQNGANPAIADKRGTTPITLARLLGFEEIAQTMEKKAGRKEPLRFPKFSPPADFSSEEKKAAAYVIPILLGQGNPLGRLTAVSTNPKTRKDEARRELKWMFGIDSASDLKDELDALEKFQPRYRDESGDLFPGFSRDEFGAALKTAAQKIHASCMSADVSDETAWTQSHILYLADLGVDAEYLTQAQATQLIASASDRISSTFTSWPTYVKSFVLGARFHNGWQADRYQHICDRIMEAGVPWPQ